MRDSMSRADNCHDNAFMESGLGTVRNKLEMTEYKTIHDALKEISPYVRYYNFERTLSLGKSRRLELIRRWRQRWGACAEFKCKAHPIPIFVRWTVFTRGHL